MFAEIDFPAQFGHVVGASVDVVQDDERTVGSRCRECPEPERCAFVDIAGNGPAVEDVVSVFPFEYLLREDAVAVFRVGPKPFQADAVQRLAGLFAPGHGFVAAFVLRGVETASVVLGCLDPRQSGFVGSPQDGYAVFGHVAQPRAMRDLEILGRQRQCRCQPEECE